MELTWINKLRIAAVAAVGIVVIGILAWPLAAPVDPLLPVRAGSIGFSGTVVLLLLTFGVGFAGYFIAWPHGREIGILAVPFALAVWAGRSGLMQAMTQAVHEPAGREALLRSLRFEPVYWLLLVAAGFAGVLGAQRIRPGSQTPPSLAQMRDYFKKSANTMNVIIGVLVSTVVTAFFLGAFAQDLGTTYRVAATQPAIGQIVFAVIAAFAVAAFVAKKFLNLSYVWPAVGSLLVLPFASLVYGDNQTVTRFVETEPAAFYPHAVFAILPLQLVALGTLGCVAGYWLAIRYNYWRQHESGQ